MQRIGRNRDRSGGALGRSPASRSGVGVYSLRCGYQRMQLALDTWGT